MTTEADITQLLAAQDAIWLSALGFTHREHSRMQGGYCWHHETLHMTLQHKDLQDKAGIIRQVLRMTQHQQEEATQKKLREALFDAMGLTTTKVVYDRPDGYGSYDSIELCDDVIKVR